MRRVAAIATIACGLIVLGGLLRPIVFPPQEPAPLLNSVEVGFAQDMIEHHGQALAMVDRLDPAVDPAVSRLGRQISDAQRVEIGTMLGWLRLANESPASAHPMSWMPQKHHTSMPGMATMEELNALAEARGRDAEILFLQLMLRHHQGGADMAESVDRLLDRGPVKEAAGAMFDQQGQEIGLIAVMLTQLGAPLS